MKKTTQTFFPHTVKDGDGCRLCCNSCGKTVSTLFHPVETEMPDKELVVRAFIQCPECLAALAGLKI